MEKNDGGPFAPVINQAKMKDALEGLMAAARDNNEDAMINCTKAIMDAVISGASIRDWFAGKALQGMIASDPVVDRTAVDKAVWASVSYEFADAMLEARKK